MNVRKENKLLKRKIQNQKKKIGSKWKPTWPKRNRVKSAGPWTANTRHTIRVTAPLVFFIFFWTLFISSSPDFPAYLLLHFFHSCSNLSWRHNPRARSQPLRPRTAITACVSSSVNPSIEEAPVFQLLGIFQVFNSPTFNRFRFCIQFALNFTSILNMHASVISISPSHIRTFFLWLLGNTEILFSLFFRKYVLVLSCFVVAKGWRILRT